MKLERPQAPLQSIKQRLRQFDVVSVWTEPFDALLQPDDVPIDLGDVPIRQGKRLTVAGLIHSQDGSTDMRTALGQSPRPQSRRACVGTPVSKACVRPRARREAGAQLAARQLNCESVFRGMLNYVRERNNAPAGSRHQLVGAVAELRRRVTLLAPLLRVGQGNGRVAAHPEDAGRAVEDFNWMLRVIVRSVALPGHHDWDK